MRFNVIRCIKCGRKENLLKMIFIIFTFKVMRRRSHAHWQTHWFQRKLNEIIALKMLANSNRILLIDYYKEADFDLRWSLVKSITSNHMNFIFVAPINNLIKDEKDMHTIHINIAWLFCVSKIDIVWRVNINCKVFEVAVKRFLNAIYAAISSYSVPFTIDVRFNCKIKRNNVAI